MQFMTVISHNSHFGMCVSERVGPLASRLYDFSRTEFLPVFHLEKTLQVLFDTWSAHVHEHHLYAKVPNKLGLWVFFNRSPGVSV